MKRLNEVRLITKKEMRLPCACGDKDCWVSFERGEDGEVWVTLKGFMMEKPREVILWEEELAQLRGFLKEGKG